MIARELCEAAYFDAVRACNPTHLVEAAALRHAIRPPIIGLAVGKAARAMARGLPDVSRGLCISNMVDDHELPPHWTFMRASHPLPDASSVAAGLAALALVESAGGHDTIVALISGGASAMLEVPAPGLSLEDLRTRTSAAMAAGVPIDELNRLRTSLSAIKGGQLADRALVPVLTLAISDVVGDSPYVVGSGPTVHPGRGDDRVEVIAPLALFGTLVVAALAARGCRVVPQAAPLTDDVTEVAVALAHAGYEGPLLAWGEPTVTLPPDAGYGGRATQLALWLALHLRGSKLSAFVAASDGTDGNTDAAGAFVDDTTWDAIVAAGLDPRAELERCNATHALATVGAVFRPGPTGINHADIVVIG